MKHNVYTHGRGGYTSGCRCDVCRAADASYSAERRAAIKAQQEPTDNRRRENRQGLPPSGRKPQEECEQGHPIKVYPGGRRGCPVCDVRRHREKRERDRAGSGPAKGPDVVSLGDIAVMLGKDKSYAQWVMSKPGAPVGTPTRSGRIWARPAVRKFIETWEPGWHPSKGPRGTCDQGHTLEVRDDGTRIPCRICDVRRHKSPAVREANAAGMRARRAAEKRQRDKIQQDEQGSGK